MTPPVVNLGGLDYVNDIVLILPLGFKGDTGVVS